MWLGCIYGLVECFARIWVCERRYVPVLSMQLKTDTIPISLFVASI
jgi:hypothetical protein